MAVAARKLSPVSPAHPGFQTLYESCREILVTTKVGGRNVAPGRSTRTIVDGLTQGDPPAVDGWSGWLSPEEILGVYVNRLVIDPDGDIYGYQRKLTTQRARAMADAMLEGKTFPVVELSLDPITGLVEASDGQHRLVGGVIARIPVFALIRERPAEERVQLYADQGLGTRVPLDDRVLTGSQPHQLYIQEAVTDPTGSHPWSAIVGEKNTHKKISPGTADLLLTIYVYDTLAATGSKAVSEHLINQRWDPKKADELAGLLLAFGVKQEAPDVYKPAHLRALTMTALKVIARRNSSGQDIARWKRHMPRFAWGKYVHVNSSRELSQFLLAHWNYKLNPKNKVQI